MHEPGLETLSSWALEDVQVAMEPAVLSTTWQPRLTAFRKRPKRSRNFVCFCAFAWSEGTGGTGWREGGEFSLGNTNSLTFLTDLVPFPVDFPQENVPYLKENVRYLGFPRKTTAFLTFWTDFVPLPTFS